MMDKNNPTIMAPSVSQKASTPTQSGKLGLGPDHIDAAHPGTEHLGYYH